MRIDEYRPPFDTTDKMVEYISLISEQIERIHARDENFESRPKLRRDNRIRSIYSSLAIEANSLSANEVRSIIAGRAVLGPPKEIREVQNAYAAYDELGNFNPFSIQDLKKIHGIMTRCLIEESGEFRRGEEGVFDNGKCIFVAPPARLVSQLMESLFKWLNSTDTHPLVKSSVFHYEFVFIHPFADGNGRMARLWQNALLMEWQQLFQYLPLESQIHKFQSVYYDAISKSHKQGKSNIFVEFMLRMIFETLKEIVDGLNFS